MCLASTPPLGAMCGRPRPDVRLVRLVRAAGVGRPEELGKESHRTTNEEDPTLDQQLRSEEG